MDLTICQRCGNHVASHEVIHYTAESGSQEFCTKCFNADVAERSGIDNFDNHGIDPISLLDVAGVSHIFHFRTRLMGADMVVLEAFELEVGTPSGYRFQMVADPYEDRFTQLGRLVQKIRRSLAIGYLADTAHGLQIKDMEVRGHIEADLSDEGSLFDSRAPMLIIDGREVTWKEFGHMLMTFEGYQFKLQIADPIDDPNN
ncbi:hypothetical protein [Polaromonas sp. CG_9.11]|uniref:DUF7713 domain-containing protein n=1 Tax=Polaromonas sp. CG_9.11 TaxID=2787730 RepID=UPI0018C91ED8|nr:hypothetical protein [Polaromonas sp. CG_9.11]MBG6075357.1 hypothetical protein [Polaromonas sp. CG_9.11]